MGCVVSQIAMEMHGLVTKFGLKLPRKWGFTEFFLTCHEGLKKLGI
jgi:hypothetical protein